MSADDEVKKNLKKAVDLILRYGPKYQTSIAVLILNVPANYLPIYQR